MFKGIPQSGNTLGSPNAPVTMVEYIDLQCPYCREFETVVLPKLLTNYVRTGKLRIEQRLLAFIGPDSVRGRNAALAAGRQNKQFNFSELLYFNQGTENTGWLDQNMVNDAAASIPGLDAEQLKAAQGSPAVAARAHGARRPGAGGQCRLDAHDPGRQDGNDAGEGRDELPDRSAVRDRRDPGGARGVASPAW